MNERINELAKQAERTVGGTFTFNGGEVSIVDLEKFAELIVRECAGIAETAEPYQSSDLIKKHFGVEE